MAWANCAERGQPLDHAQAQRLEPELLEAVAAAQGVGFAPGDILLLRTGWPQYYDEVRRTGAGNPSANAGIAQSRETLRWIWDTRFALVAADNFALEAYPPQASSEFYDHGLIHPELIAMLGLVVGELWAFDALAADCAADGVYEFMVVVKPLYVTGGVGAPANATAIK